MANTPKPLPLSDELRRRIGRRKVRVAVFLTYEFEPSFFETEVIQTLFDCDWSRNPRVALAQAEDVLRKVDQVAVYYDVRALVGTESAALDYRRFGACRPGGVFHPKNIILLLEEDTEFFRGSSLLLITTSANLTQSGWWRNLEAVHALEIPEGSKTLIRDDLLGEDGLLSRVTQHEKTGALQSAIEEIRKFLRYKTESALKKTQNGTRRPRLFAGQQRFGKFVVEEMGIDPGEFNLEIISPYFDNTDEAVALQEFLEELQPRQTRIFLSRSPEGKILCRKEYFEAVSAIPRVTWGLLPAELTRYSSRHEHSADRFVHAKVYRLFSIARDQEFLAVGSVNMTEAAHSNARSGNLESAVVSEASSPTMDWWLKRDEQTYPPESFEPAEEPNSSNLKWYEVVVEFDWETSCLSYFWKSSQDMPLRAEIRHRSLPIIRLDPIEYDQWRDLPDEVGQGFREGLLATSIVEITPESCAPQMVLVREEGMIAKPSLTVALKPEEILEFWSLLSPEQRAAHIADKLEKLANARASTIETSPAEQPVIHSMFDRFAGIFHAFSCFRQLVEESVFNGHPGEAKCLLFGSKHDSLKVLVNRLSEPGDFDDVNRYVILLCSSQILRELQPELAAWMADYKREIAEVRDLIDASLAKAREQLQRKSDDTSDIFLDWFEKMFVMEIPVVAQQDQL